MTPDIISRIGELAAQFGIPRTDELSGFDGHQLKPISSSKDSGHVSPSPIGDFTDEERVYLSDVCHAMNLVLYEVEDCLAEENKTDVTELELSLQLEMALTPDLREDWTYLISVCTNYDVHETDHRLVRCVQKMLRLQEKPQWYSEVYWMFEITLGALMR